MNIPLIQSMINAIEQPAIFLTPEYTILAVNEAYRDTYEAEIQTGTSRCFEISHGHSEPCDKHGEDCPMQQCISSDRAHSVVHIHNTSVGKTYCDIVMRPVKDQDGMTIGFLEILERINFAASHSQTNKMIGSSESFKQMLAKINRVAKSDIAVLLHGQTGTGKELVAKALHDSSKRADMPFVVIECTGLNDNLFESELFGHEKGSFTGATQAKKGLIEIANGGTVFFDEIADVPLNMQVKLLRLLETGTYRTVGGLKQKTADFRLVSASHQNLLDAVKAGKFRQDLYYRIAGFYISLPALTERNEDIPLLARHLLRHSEFSDKKFSEAAMKRLCDYSFPGNIRELKSIVEQSALMANEDAIEIDDLPEHLFGTDDTHEGESQKLIPLDDAEGKYLKEVCATQSISIDDLATSLKVSKRTLYRKLEKHGLKYKG